MQLVTTLPVFVLVSVFLCSIGVHGYGDPNIWPLPQQVTYGDSSTRVNQPFHFFPSPDGDDIDAAIERYLPLMFPHSTHTNDNTSSVFALDITVLQSDTALQLGTDEAYNLTVPLSGHAVLIANTVYGALRGLETFAQLLRFSFDDGFYYIDQAPWTIVDFPRFPHRGIMLDSARHFHPVLQVRQLMDSMAYAKFNVLHLHLSDTQSFPLQSVALPLLSAAAYSAFERYSLEDLADLVEYGRQRGIRLMLETDMPGHAASWCVGYPHLCPAVSCPQPLDPSNEETFTVIRLLLQELTSVVPDSLYHVGGDEVDTTCWNQTAHIRQWMDDRGFTPEEALFYFTQRVHDIVHNLTRTPVSWDEVYKEFTTRLDPSTIVHVWRLTQLQLNATSDGYRTILSVDIPWYLDNSYTWQMMYATDPWDGLFSEKQRRLALGGESCMWSEGVDAGDLFNTVWPRAAAVAEKLWSAWEVDDVLAATPRYASFRCLLNSRGIGAAPHKNAFRTAPLGPGGCLDQ